MDNIGRSRSNYLNQLFKTLTLWKWLDQVYNIFDHVNNITDFKYNISDYMFNICYHIYSIPDHMYYIIDPLFITYLIPFVWDVFVIYCNCWGQADWQTKDKRF